MSALTMSNLAFETITEVDSLLKRFSEALERGDVSTEQSIPIVDALLEARTASSLAVIPENRTTRKASA